MQSRVDNAFMRRVGILVAAAALYVGSPTLVDRLANALSVEAAQKVLYDSERIIYTGIGKEDLVQLEKCKDCPGSQRDLIEETKDMPCLLVKVKDQNYCLVGHLASEIDVSDFFEAVSRDSYVARQTGALAMSMINEKIMKAGIEVNKA